MEFTFFGNILEVEPGLFLLLHAWNTRLKQKKICISVNGEIVKILIIPIGNLGSVLDPIMNVEYVSKAVKSAN